MAACTTKSSARDLGRSSSKEQYAFLYDTAAIEVNRHSIYTVNDPDDLLHREPLVAMFRVRGPPPQQAFTFVLVNIHTDPHEADTEARFAGPGVSSGAAFQCRRGRHHPAGRSQRRREAPRSAGTNRRRPARRAQHVHEHPPKRHYDNFLLHQPSTAEFTGRWGVFNYQQLFKLTPDQALQVSDHLPIWAEFNAYESATPGRVANRDAATIRAQ